MQFLNGSGKAFNTIGSNDINFFEELHAVIDREPIEMLEPQLRGIFASIGIQKGKPFKPDGRMKGDPVQSGGGGQRDSTYDALVRTRRIGIPLRGKPLEEGLRRRVL